MWASELWTNVSADNASLEPEEIQEVRPLIAGATDQTHLMVHGGKGLPAESWAAGGPCAGARHVSQRGCTWHRPLGLTLRKPDVNLLSLADPLPPRG